MPHCLPLLVTVFVTVFFVFDVDWTVVGSPALLCQNLRFLAAAPVATSKLPFGPIFQHFRASLLMPGSQRNKTEHNIEMQIKLKVSLPKSQSSIDTCFAGISYDWCKGFIVSNLTDVHESTRDTRASSLMIKTIMGQEKSWKVLFHMGSARLPDYDDEMGVSSPNDSISSRSKGRPANGLMQSLARMYGC